jgi:3',5'-cyclic AMP phosphodiesterase CpdA
LPIFLVSDRWDEINLPVYARLLARKQIVGGVSLAMLNDASECARVRYDIRRAVKVAWGVAATSIGPDDDLRVLHMSDLQFGAEWVAKTDPEVAGDRIINDLFQALPTAATGRVLNPHILAVTGDIAQHGEPRELLYGFEFLERLRKKLSVPRDSCFVIPGNHDVSVPLASSHLIDYSFGKPFAAGGRRSNPRVATTGLEMRGLERFGLVPFYEACDFFTGRHDWTQRSRIRDVPAVWFHGRAFVPFGLSILGLNTVTLLGPEDPSRAEVPQWAVNSISENLEAFKLEVVGAETAVHLVLLHHSPWRGLGDRTLGNDGELLLSQLGKHGHCVFLFGHIHTAVSNVRTYTAQSKRQALFISSSTVSLASAARPEDSLRGFNLISLERKQDVVVSARVQRFDFTGLEYRAAPEQLFKKDEKTGWLASGT